MSDKINSKTRIKTIFIIVCLIAFVTSTAFGMTIKEEEDMGKQYMQYIQSHLRLVRDPDVVEYINTIGNRIIASLPEEIMTFRFYVVNESDMNAFAGPGGHVFINSGLIEAMESEEELAGILAHEIAHVVCRHLSEWMQRSQKIGMATVAAIIAGAILGGKSAGPIAISSLAANQTLSLAYSRENEREADQIGIRYLTQAGYGASGLLNVLQKIRQNNWLGVAGIPPYMTTHPATEERIAYIDSWISTHQAENKGTYHDPALFGRVHTRLSALYGDESNIERYKKELVKNPTNPYSYYGYGLMLARLGKRRDAIDQFKKAIQYNATDSTILKELGKLYYYEGQYKQALKILSGALEPNTNQFEIRLFLASTQSHLEQYKEAIDNFEQLLPAASNYPRVWYYLGETYGKQNELDQAHYYLGLYYNNLMDYKNASFHLKKALEYEKNKNTSNRKEEIEKLLKELKPDHRP